MRDWIFEKEEIEGFVKIISELKNDEDKFTILNLIEKVSVLSGYTQACEEFLKIKQPE